MTRPIVRYRRSGQRAIDRLQGPEYFRSATDRFIRIGSLKHGDVSSVFAILSLYGIGAIQASILIYLSSHRFSSNTEQNLLYTVFCLCQDILIKLVPLDGIEPTIDAYKATVIPFN